MSTSAVASPERAIQMETGLGGLPNSLQDTRMRNLVIKLVLPYLRNRGRIRDIGCGAGHVSETLSSLYPCQTHICLSDANDDLITEAHRRVSHANKHVKQLTVTQMKVELPEVPQTWIENPAQITIVLQVFFYLTEREALLAINRLAPTIERGGLLAISVLTPEWAEQIFPKTDPSEPGARVVPEPKGGTRLEYYRSRQFYLPALTAAGFDVTAVTTSIPADHSNPRYKPYPGFPLWDIYLAERY